MTRPDVAAKLLRARLRLMLSQPYLAAAIARLPLIDASDRIWCRTAATDGYHIYTNDQFIADLSDDDTAFVLAHELMHCLLGHLDRRGERDRLQWNVAIDYATNGLLAVLGMIPPESALHNRYFDGHTAEDIYAQLNRRGGFGGWPTTTLDVHLDPDDGEGADFRALDFPSSVERRRMRVSLSAELRSKLVGTQAGLFSAELEAGANPAVPWQQLLSRFVTGLRRSDYRLFPPNRKHLWRGLYLPAAGAPGPEHLVLAIDTSGSMSDEDLREILGELDALRTVSECVLTVIQCDAAIQALNRFEPYENSYANGRTRRHELYGRGGTDLRPPFDWIVAQMNEGERLPDALIYCTDGYGALPDSEPDFPVLWMVTRHGKQTWPWGEMITHHKDPGGARR